MSLNALPANLEARRRIVTLARSVQMDRLGFRVWVLKGSQRVQEFYKGYRRGLGLGFRGFGFWGFGFMVKGTRVQSLGFGCLGVSVCFGLLSGLKGFF